ncbi:MAG: DUF6711 family protein [Ruthenibacterium sp.]
MAMITADTGILIPSPVVGGYELSISTLVDGGRNARGQFVGQVIGDDKLKVSCALGALSQTEMHRFLCLFDRASGGQFVHQFLLFDPRINDFVWKEMYVGDRSGKAIAVDARGKVTNWGDVKASLIEV